MQRCKLDVSVGDVFGRYTVTIAGLKRGNHKYAECKCTCGTVKQVRQSSLIDGDTKSCGCLAKELAKERLKKHGLSRHPLFQRWHDMHRRCYNPERKDYKHYGGRGIKVCDHWSGDEGFINFLNDMASYYIDGYELDREDVNGDYCKENCRWVTRRDQVINRRPFDRVFDTHFITHDSRTMCISQWADELGVQPSLLSDRICKLGWSVSDALTPIKRFKKIEILYDGEVLSVRDIFTGQNPISKLANKHLTSSFLFLGWLFDGIAEVRAHSNRSIVTYSKENSPSITGSVWVPKMHERFKNLYQLAKETMNCKLNKEKA